MFVQTLIQKIQSEPRSGWFISPRQRAFVFALFLVVGTVVLFYPVSNHPFANYDDDFYVTQNVHVKSGLHWETVKWAFTTYEYLNWHPLTWISHAMDYQMFQLDPSGHHETNVVLHVMNVALLFFMLLQATGFAGRSFMVAALFAWHPINVESVAWIAERKNLLSMFFLLLALIAYRWYAHHPRIGRYTVVGLLFALGLMAKPQVITFPFLLLLWDYWPLRRMLADRSELSSEGMATVSEKRFSWLLLEKLPLFGICAASAVVTVLAARTGDIQSGVYFHTFSVRLENAIVSYVDYIGKAFWPSGLALYYPYPSADSLVLWRVMAALGFLLTVTALVVTGRRQRYLPVGWFWFLGTLVPMIGLKQVGIQSMADRYAYLSFIGLFIMVCWGVAQWARERHVPSAALAIVSALVLLAAVVMSHRQIAYWDDNVTLWSHALAVTNRNWLAEDHLGEALLAEGQNEKAISHLQASAAINPYGLFSHLQIAFYEDRHGNLTAAIQEYRKAQEVTKNVRIKSEAYISIGLDYLSLGDYINARESYQAALGLQSHATYRAWIGLGLTAQKSGDLSQAIQDYSRSIQATPSDIGYLLLAQALQQTGRKSEAQEALQRAKDLSRNFAGAQQTSEDLLRR